MRGWIVLVTIMAWVAFSPEVRAETALIPLYQDVLQNCKGASESTRERIIRTASTSGRDRTLHVSSAMVQELSDREPDPYPAYVASSVGLCGVTVSDPSRAASLKPASKTDTFPCGNDATDYFILVAATCDARCAPTPLARAGGAGRSAGGALGKGYFFFFFVAAAAAWAAWVLTIRCWNLSTRPAVSTSFCLPVKNGWHAEQIST